MTISSPSELFAFLEEIGASPNRALSQNFLIDANIVRKIVSSANVQEGDKVLEIGPGPGALTQELLARGASVLAIEKDRRFSSALSRFSGSKGHLQVIEGDILEFPFETLEQCKVIANIPYHITTPILERLFKWSHLFTDAYLMVQKEVSERMNAKPGTKERSAFTIFLNTYCDPSVALNVSRHCFYPAPEVDSCVIKLSFRKPLLNDPKPFLAIVRKAFQQRRKMLRSTLSIDLAPYSTLRPEALSLEEWLDLYSRISAQTDATSP